MFLRQRILVADVRIVDAVQRHVHRADAQHGAVEVEAVEHLLVEMVARDFFLKQLRMVVAQIFACRDQEAAGAAGGSQITSLGPGAIMSTISAMMCAGCGTARSDQRSQSSTTCIRRGRPWYRDPPSGYWPGGRLPWQQRLASEW